MNGTIEVLMVEDNPGDVVLFREAVAKAGLGYGVRVVRDGDDATDYLRGTGAYSGVAVPDLVVLDLKLPRKSGRELLYDIRRDRRMKPPLIVVLSSSQSELELAKSEAEDGETYMTKPGTFDGFVELVEHIEKERRDTAGRATAG